MRASPRSMNLCSTGKRSWGTGNGSITSSWPSFETVSLKLYCGAIGGESQERPRVGRPRAYDRDAALLAARDLFWEQGYERTSIADLEERTGLNRSSLYQEFGSKQKLFEASLECYADRIISGLLAGLRGGTVTGLPGDSQ